jgi:hypothetical protein
MTLTLLGNVFGRWMGKRQFTNLMLYQAFPYRDRAEKYLVVILAYGVLHGGGQARIFADVP